MIVSRDSLSGTCSKDIHLKLSAPKLFEAVLLLTLHELKAVKGRQMADGPTGVNFNANDG